MSIQNYAITRGIRELLHFTRVENLPSILARGLLKRNVIASNRTTELFNDEFRLDRTDAICASIGFPNYKMFYRLRTLNSGTEWVVISIHPAALWQLRCAFCATNAASSAVAATPLINRMTLTAFESMYADFGNVRREDLRIPDAWTTNPQAETLFLDGIPNRFFMGVYTETTALRERLAGMNLGVEFRTNPSLFSPRLDYRHWQNR